MKLMRYTTEYKSAKATLLNHDVVKTYFTNS